MRRLEKRNEQGVQELHRGCRLVARVIVKDYHLLLVTVLNSNSHLQISQEVSELLLLSGRAREVDSML